MIAQANFKLDKPKAKAAILYIATRLEDKSMHRIFKILYFAEKDHLVKYGMPITGDDFIAMEYGPVPSYIYDEVKLGRDNKSIDPSSLASSITFDSRNNYINSTEEADLDEFSDSDIECLDLSILENKDVSFQLRTAKSHDEAWNNAFNSGTSTKKMRVSDIAKAAGADEKTLNVIKISGYNSNIQLY